MHSTLSGESESSANYKVRLEELAARNVAMRLRYKRLLASAQMLLADADARMDRPTFSKQLLRDRATVRRGNIIH
jgi:hypothetical protein